MFDLAQKVAMVTGANTGIGQAVALALAAAGADVAVVGRSDATATLEAVRAAGRRALQVSADLSRMQSLPDVVAQTLAEFGRIDILVNNAGTIRRAAAVDYSEADWDTVMDTNIKAVFFLSQQVARHMLPRGSGKIIQIASMLSFQGGIRVPAYTASKSGIAGVTRALANEWGPQGINVNAIAPGYIATNNTAALQTDATRNRQILERIPASRWGQPQDIGGAAVFLASRAADYVHGHVLAVDGGWLAR